jgi:hypothetical protein
MSKAILVKFCWDCRRQGRVEGIFVTTQEELDSNYGKEVIFGEILGKHSDIQGVFEACDITVLSEDQEFIAKFEEIIGYTGFCPFDYIRS